MSDCAFSPRDLTTKQGQLFPPISHMLWLYAWVFKFFLKGWFKRILMARSECLLSTLWLMVYCTHICWYKTSRFSLVRAQGSWLIRDNPFYFETHREVFRSCFLFATWDYIEKQEIDAFLVWQLRSVSSYSLHWVGRHIMRLGKSTWMNLTCYFQVSKHLKHPGACSTLCPIP